MTLNSTQLLTLSSICDTFFPATNSASGSASGPASGQSLSDNIPYLEALQASILSLDDSKIFEMKLLLTALSTAVGTNLLIAMTTVSTIPFAFPARTLEQRTECLYSLMTSSLEIRRKVFVGLKRLILGLALSYVDHAGKNIYWEDITYSGPPKTGQDAEFPKLHIEQISSTFKSSTVDLETVSPAYDYIVIGSGAGGGVAASTLGENGASVLVCEKATPVPQTSMSQVESEAFGSLYENSGLLTTVDGNLIILAGSSLGGGTTINWACCLDTPAYVRDEWVENHGLEQFKPDPSGDGSGAFDLALKHIKKRIGVTENVTHNDNNKILIEGCDKAGFKWKVAPQNFKHPHLPSCGFTCFGDKNGNKQGTAVTFLADAASSKNKNTHFLGGCYVNRIIRGKFSNSVNSVEVTVNNITRTITANKSIIVSAGSLHTPGLLKRSKFTNPHIGAHLRLHPCTAVVGEFKDPVAGYQGAPMTTVCTEDEMGPTGDGYGAKIECPSAHPGLMASSLPWTSGKQYREDIKKLNNTSAILILQRDFGEGTVDVGADGQVRVDYKICAKDKKSMFKSMRSAVQILRLAGSKKISTLNSIPRHLEPKTGGKGEILDGDVEQFCLENERLGMSVNGFGVFCAHQMGSCRMGISSEASAVDQNGECWEADNVYVMDASVFPTASGSNPMITTLAISRMLSKRLLDGGEEFERERLQRREENRRKFGDGGGKTGMGGVAVKLGLVGVFVALAYFQYQKKIII